MRKFKLFLLLAASIALVTVLFNCAPEEEPPTFESPVGARWTTPVPQVVVGDVVTTSVGISWDDYTQVVGASFDWAALIELELRKSDGSVVKPVSFSPNCGAKELEPGQGWCSEPVAVRWETDGLSPGDYEVFVRLTWVNAVTGEVIYGYLEGATSQDGQNFFILEKFRLTEQTFFPLVIKGGR